MNQRTLIRTLAVMTAVAFIGGALALGMILGFRYGDISSSEFRRDGRVQACDLRITVNLTRLDDPFTAEEIDAGLPASLARVPDECDVIADQLDPVLVAALDAHT